MGLPIMLAEFSAKRLELLKDAMPRITRVAVLWDPPTAYHTTAIDGLKAGSTLDGDRIEVHRSANARAD